MIKLMIVGRRDLGRSRTAAHDHLRNVHGRMVVCSPANAGTMPADYVQNHVLDGAYPGTGAHAIERDLVTELWFDSVDALRASTSTPYYLQNLKPDEPRFVDDATVVRMLVRPEQIGDGPKGAFKAFWLLGGGDDAGIVRLADRSRALPGLGFALNNHVLPPPDGSERFVETVLEGWFEDLAAARAAVDCFAGILEDIAPEMAPRSLALLAEEHDTARLQAHLAAGNGHAA